MSQNNDFVLYTQNWCNEPILNLADHFHLLNSQVGQQKRLSEYRMEGENDLARFNTIVADDSISRIEMHLGLTAASNCNEFTSCFYMKVYHGVNAIDYFKLSPFEKPPVIPTNDIPISDIVPQIFKEMIANNWDEVENHLIDDLFIAKDGPIIERVHYFLIGDTMTTFIKELLNGCSYGIEGIKIYAGIDLNKFSNKKTISFTPVLGIKLPDAIIDSMLMAGNVNCLLGEVLLEYSMPCPPVCKPIEENY
ncbi:MAG: hypothetical protein GQ574_02890 [Crocinitomix sp.]|nr:hypothetical protein [Crocinitomix sp.]